MGCYSSKAKKTPRYEDPVVLAAETPFTVSEVEAVHELYKKLSSSIYDDGLIHKIFRDADEKVDGRIDQQEWKDYVLKHDLKDITLVFPSEFRIYVCQNAD